MTTAQARQNGGEAARLSNPRSGKPRLRDQSGKSAVEATESSSGQLIEVGDQQVHGAEAGDALQLLFGGGATDASPKNELKSSGVGEAGS